jgi:leucyl aminopeptidase
MNLDELLTRRNFHGKPGDCLSVDRIDATPACLVLVGLGEASAFDSKDLRLATTRAVRAAARMGAKSIGLAMPLVHGMEPQRAVAAMAEAARLCLYVDQRYLSEPEPQPNPDYLEFLDLPQGAQAGLASFDAVCAGVELARQLVAAPPNVLTPAALAEAALAIADTHALELRVLERSDCEALGMGAYLGVAKGSDLPPKFIHLTYRPAGEVRRRVVLVGKGVTFDSGGYNLKTTGSMMDLMKFDMGGGAAVLGTAKAIGQLKPDGVEVHVLIPSCENMVNGGAFRPGDILTASNGKTIEVKWTDAEGRLTLVDALIYAAKLNPDAIIDVATLTGACVIALGDEIAGLWSNSDILAEALILSSKVGGEMLWRMPLQNSYKPGLKSLIADIQNLGPRSGGSIVAALFLQDFVPKMLPWAHLDIAGPVWSEKEHREGPAGATGFGVRTLVNWILAGCAA